MEIISRLSELVRAFDLMEFIRWGGLMVVWGMVFAESGLLIGFFLPGDSLLFTAGFLASQGVFNEWALWLGSIIAAVTGDAIGYWFGHRWGRGLFKKEDSLLFHKDNLLKAEKFYEEHGKKTIIIARFLPVIRTFAPIVAGIAKMEYRNFALFNVVGALLWAGGVSMAGYWLGSLIPDVDKYLLPIVAGIIIVSILPPVFHILKDRRAAK
ncbi:VTT domain-containing protein [Candidatus Collierbacteria bacterium]|nr:VTT domain-containing protein [Candidatus Collierbacteria bacterium]